jgi:hypothetical protein
MNEHLEKVGMTRWQHFKHAVNIAYRMEKAVCAVCIHAIFPKWFQSYASDTCATIAKENNKI